jgi:hypothetical protein
MSHLPGDFSADLRDANRDAALQWSSLGYRHTSSGGGSHLAQRGIILYKIATLTGNSAAMCRRPYAAFMPEAMAAMVEFLSSSQDIQRTA